MWLRHELFYLRFAVASKTAASKKPAAKSTKKPTRVAPARKSTRSAPAKRAASAKPAAARSKQVKPAKRPAQAAKAVKKSAATTSRPKSRAGSGARRDFALDKLHQVALQATNLDDAVNFYENVLGLRLITRYDPPGLAFFDMGGFRLLLSATASEATLYFRVDDIGSAVKSLKKRGVSFLQSPAMVHRDEAGDFGKKGVEEWMAFFKDPSGNLIALIERR